MSKTPNLFHYATSELSQDAFICWLLKWGDESHKEGDEQLHACAHDFIRAMLKKDKNSKDFTIKTVEVTRQWSVGTKSSKKRALDILCEINRNENDSTVILIEDKTFSSQHSGQLDSYQSYAQDKFPASKIVCIYLKARDQSKPPCDKGWHPFMREDFLAVLNNKKSYIDNNIFLDFHHHLENIEQRINSWESIPLKSWTCDSWTGFYIWLQEELKGHWRTVNRPSGAFKAFHWNWTKKNQSDSEGLHLYLQIETEWDKASKTYQSNICFKAWSGEWGKEVKLSSNTGKIWYKKIEKYCKEHLPDSADFSGSRPTRIGSGETITVYKIKNSVLTTPDGKIDKNHTLERLKKITSVIEPCN